MAILVTGGAGYIGCVTVAHLRTRGEQVVVLDNLSRGHRQALNNDVRFYHGEVGDRELVATIVRENRIESCIHFAAVAYVGESIQQPRLYLENNLVQGLALFGALIQSGVRHVVFSSTCATYGEPEILPVREDAMQWPRSPYGWSKLLLERALASYDAAHGLKFVALRYFNAAGASATHGEHHDPETHLIPNVLLAASGVHEHVSVFGDTYPTPDGTAVRDFVHVSDLAEGHVRALDHLRQGGASEFLNLGSGHGHSVLEVIETAREVTGRRIAVVIEPPRPGDPSRLVADPSKGEKLLGWRARRSELAVMIRSAWEWQQRHPQGYADDRTGAVAVT